MPSTSGTMRKVVAPLTAVSSRRFNVGTGLPPSSAAPVHDVLPSAGVLQGAMK
jgi:hypothetical protein